MDLSGLYRVFDSIPLTTRDIMLRLALLLIALILAWGLRHVVAMVFIRPLRFIAGRTKNEYDDLFFSSIERPISLAILGIVFRVVINLLGFEPAIQQLAAVVSRTLIIAAIGLGLYNMLDMLFFTPNTVRRITGVKMEDRLIPFLRTAAKVFVVVVSALIILQEFGYDVTALIASFGIVGIGIGLAAQDTAANIFAFIAIVSDNPFQVGDYIETEKASGKVEHVGVRSTRLRKLDQTLLSVPNSYLAAAALTNWTRQIKRRLDFTMDVHNFASTEQLRNLVAGIRALLEARQVVEKNNIVVNVSGFTGGRSVQIRVTVNLLLKDFNAYNAEVEFIHMTIIDLMASMRLIDGVTPTPQRAPAAPIVASDVPDQASPSNG
jgi:MscS family membrane protein